LSPRRPHRLTSISRRAGLATTALGLSLGVGRLGGIVGPAYGGFVIAFGLGQA
jgi:hypothetical protein